MSSYNFPNIVVNKAGAFDDYIRSNASFASLYNGCSTGPLIVFTTTALSQLQFNELTTLVNAYTDPAVYYQLNNKQSSFLHSHYTNDVDNITDISSGNFILQTFIFSPDSNTSDILNSAKTVIEYTCFNPSTFHVTSGNINLELYDITRNYQILMNTIDCSDILTQFSQMTSITKPTSLFKTTQLFGLNSQFPNYDVVLQLRANQTMNLSDMAIRYNGLQYLFYTAL